MQLPTEAATDPILTRCPKTVFIIDRRPSMLENCGERIDLDASSTPSTTASARPARTSFEKQLWTCAAEAVVEYCRVVFDIFPDQCRIAIICADAEPAIINSWDTTQQTLPELLTLLASHNIRWAEQRTPNPDHPLQPLTTALAQAVSLLAMPVSGDQRSPNKSRIVCMSRLESPTLDANTEISHMTDCLSQLIGAHNMMVTDDDVEQQRIDHVEFNVLNTVPITTSLPQSIGSALSKISKELSSSSRSLHSGSALTAFIYRLVQHHYRLVCTTVTGIPMKEEQGTGTSSSYDVPLLHPSDVHDDMMRTDSTLACIKSVTASGFTTRTATLKWITPKAGATADNYFTTAAGRVSPVDVQSRPSACLTNFILAGRTVTLELIRKSSKVQSHMLVAHDRDIYIHSLLLPRVSRLSQAGPQLDELPSIIEGVGGKVIDYRIPEFQVLLQRATLIPSTPATPSGTAASSLISTLTTWFPMATSQSAVIQALPTNLRLATIIEFLLEPTSGGEASAEHVQRTLNLLLTAKDGSGSAMKDAKASAKREESVARLHTELGTILEKLSTRSADNLSLYHLYLKLREPAKLTKIKEEQSSSGDAKSKRALLPPPSDTTDSAKAPKLSAKLELTPGATLASLWSQRLAGEVDARRRDFEGRADGALLYPNLYSEVKHETVATSSDFKPFQPRPPLDPPPRHPPSRGGFHHRHPSRPPPPPQQPPMPPGPQQRPIR